MNIPKLFLSYCWSTPDHEQWVVSLANELTQAGISVVFDKWDLREGHDAVAFMEKMVTDESITKVAMVCDKVYAEKADGRRGGVGTETQIISREVYESTDQNKFVAVIAERDSSGAPFLPTYYKSRIYIDLSDTSNFAENFEKLVRWVFDRPLYVRPQLGTPPSFVTESEAFSLGTSSLAKRAIEGVKAYKGFAKGALEEYLTTFAANLERLRITDKSAALDEQVVSKVDAFEASRNEFIQVLTAFVQYGQSGSFSPVLHRFLESVLALYERPEEQSSGQEDEFDQFKFIGHELFLYALAIFLRNQEFESAGTLLSQPYYSISRARSHGDSVSSFTAFRAYIRSLESRNKRLGLRRLSLRADMLEKRSKSSGFPFQAVMQADFVCFMRAALDANSQYDGWWPETLLYSRHNYGAFEVFARAISSAHLKRVLPLLGVSSLEPIKAKLDEFAIDKRSLPSWDFQSFSPSTLMAFDRLGAKA
jgi:hypothetical protein